MQRMTFQEYADHRGVTLQAVRKAAKQGRISFLKDMMSGAPYVYKEEADDQWAKNTATEKSKSTKTPHAVWNNENSEYPSFNESRTKKEFYAAEKARLEFEQMEKTLVSAQDVKDETFKMFRAVRESLFTIPDRMAAQLAGETDQDKIFTLLTDEIRNSLEALTQ